MFIAALMFCLACMIVEARAPDTLMNEASHLTWNNNPKLELIYFGRPRITPVQSFSWFVSLSYGEGFNNLQQAP